MALCRLWAAATGSRVVVVFDGAAPAAEQTAALTVVGTEGETADDWLIRETRAHRPYWLVSSDRTLRAAAGTGAERIVGGGGFLRLLRAGSSA